MLSVKPTPVSMLCSSVPTVFIGRTKTIGSDDFLSISALFLETYLKGLLNQYMKWRWLLKQWLFQKLSDCGHLGLKSLISLSIFFSENALTTNRTHKIRLAYFLWAKIIELILGPTFHVIINYFGYSYSTALRQRFQPCRNMHTVTKKVVFLFDDITWLDTKAKL